MNQIGELKQNAWNLIREKQEDLVQLALQIRDNPELGYEEVASSRALMDMLSDTGFEVTQPYGGLETAFLATTARVKAHGCISWQNMMRCRGWDMDVGIT